MIINCYCLTRKSKNTTMMKSILRNCLIFSVLMIGKAAYGQLAWSAEWIAAPDIAGTEYGVYYFRKTIDLNTVPASFTVHVSADNRYKLYVNSKLVSLGPARGDTYFWNYETVDLAPFLTSGKNIVSALVFNEAEYRPEAQISQRTAFILQGNTKAEEVINTNKTWKCFRDKGRFPIPGFFFAASKGEFIDMNKMIKGDWTSINFNDGDWPYSTKVVDGKLKGSAWGIDWALVPSSLPPMEMSYQRLVSLRSAIGAKVPSSFPQKKAPVVIPANTTASLLLDQTFETNAYVTVGFSGGRDASISLGYAESLYEKGSKGGQKGNRNEVEGKEFIGRTDSLISNGSQGQSFTTLNFRTYRYLRVLVQTKKDPLVIEDLYGVFTGYPFKRIAEFNAINPEYKQILDIGWRTARLNAWETYMDCPYYEQLQYIGDTRIQTMVSYYNTNDDRLARNAITQIDHSRLAEGITKSCYPTKGSQIISPFSLWYIGMLHDYWMYRDDAKFVGGKLMGMRAILDFFSNYQTADGSLKDTPYWAFVDWAGNMWGPVKDKNGSAAIYDLQLLLAYQWAAEMEGAVGLPDFAKIYAERAKQLSATIKQKYWDGRKGLYADTEERTGFSQHVNSLAILAGIVGKEEMRGVSIQLLRDKSLTQCSIYFKYYLDQALVKAGLGDDYMNWLDIYKDNIAMGLTTWAEYSDVNTSRSDCHAWGASPNIEFFRTVLGIDSDSPGFQKIKIQPHLGKIEDVSGEIPHPNGHVSASYKLVKGKWKISVELPQKTTGILIWRGTQYSLRPGTNSFNIQNI